MDRPGLVNKKFKKKKKEKHYSNQIFGTHKNFAYFAFFYISRTNQ